jgi:hypothetical protein
MPTTTPDPRSTDSHWLSRPFPRPSLATRGRVRDAVLIVGVFACEVTAGLLVAIEKRPGLGLLFVGAGLGIAFAWARTHRRYADAIVSGRIESAKRLLADGSHIAAWNAACAAAGAAAGQWLRNAALAVLVRVALEEKHYKTARDILGRMRPRFFVDPCLEAAVERADGGVERATAALERARNWPTFDGAAARLLIELYAEANHLDRATRIAVEHLDLLEEQDIRNMIASLETWGEPRKAAVLAVALAMRMSGAARQLRFPDLMAS